MNDTGSIKKNDFVSSYSFDIIEEFSGDGQQVNYVSFSGVSNSGSDGVIVNFEFKGEQHSGVFEFGVLDNNSSTIVSSCPNQACCLVVSRGKAYLYNVEEKKLLLALGAGPVREVIPIKNRNELLLITPVTIFVLDKENNLFEAERIAIDGFEIIEVTDTFIRGHGDLVMGEDQDFVFDLGMRAVV